VIVRRGLETNNLKTPLFFEGNIGYDQDTVMQFLDKKFNNPDFYATGVSMGSNLQCRMVQRKKNNCRIKAQVCISTPFDIDKVTKNLT